MGFWEIIILIIWTAIVVFKIRRLRRRVLYLEKKWAEQQRRQSMYAELTKPTKKASSEMENFGIEDIEKAADAEKAKLRNHGIIID